MIKSKNTNEKYLKESVKLLSEAQVWERKFGEPLPTLDSVMEKYQQEGGKGSGKKPVASDANKKPRDTEKELERKAKEQAFKDMAKEEQINEKRYDDYLSNQAGIDVWRDRKLFLIAKNLNYSTKDLMKTAQKKDGKSYKDVLDRISVGVGVLKGYLNIKR
jgi:hypothetical protein